MISFKEFERNSRGIPGSPMKKQALADLETMSKEELELVIQHKNRVDLIVKQYAKLVLKRRFPK